MESRPGVTDGDGIMTGYSTYAYQVPPEQEKKSEAPLSPPPPGELHGDERPWEAEGTAVHQLEGDERDVDMGRGYMRAR